MVEVEVNEIALAVIEEKMQERIKRLLSQFDYAHLPQNLQLLSQPFHRAAHEIVNQSWASDDLILSLQLLLQAKDAAVRGALP